jgi:hypothetical protein
MSTAVYNIVNNMDKDIDDEALHASSPEDVTYLLKEVITTQSTVIMVILLIG